MTGIICEYFLPSLKPMCHRCKDKDSFNYYSYFVKLFILLNYLYLAYFIFSLIWRCIRCCLLQKNNCCEETTVCFTKPSTMDCCVPPSYSTPCYPIPPCPPDPCCNSATTVCCKSTLCCTERQEKCYTSVENIRIKINPKLPFMRCRTPLCPPLCRTCCPPRRRYTRRCGPLCC
jgi:hypothetical protein